jgi:Concanavalin A-like lectin/glucanases superfamily
VPINKWTHIGFTLSEVKMELFLNGSLDSIQLLEGRSVRPNQEKLYIGGHPAYSKACNIAFYMDNFRIYDKVLPQYALEAEVASTSGSYTPGEVLIACQNCDTATALKSCINNYHLCTSAEFYTGVAQFVKLMGWVILLLIN